ncbi:MAG: universal stress protein [Flavobacteriaceae bacterium]
MKNILIPSDFSHNALNAAHCALKMYHEVTCSFYILNAYYPNTSITSGFGSTVKWKGTKKSEREISEEMLLEMLDSLKQNNPNPKHTFHAISKSGSVLPAIKEVISNQGIDLIVMGTKGATGAKRVFMGSNTVKVIDNEGNCPIIAVPRTYDFIGLNSLIFPTDFSRAFTVGELNALVELATLWKSEIRIFHLSKQFSYNDEEKANREMLKDFFKGLELSFYKGIIDAEVPHAIAKFSQERKADLIALVHYPRSFLDKLTKEAIVKKVSFQTNVPLMVLPSNL